MNEDKMEIITKLYHNHGLIGYVDNYEELE
jgi:hypothetical protein